MGISKVIRTQPVAWLDMRVMIPRRMPSVLVMTPTYSSGQSTITSSKGSSSLSFSRLKSTRGLPTHISKPSRRIISIRIAICNSPRP